MSNYPKEFRAYKCGCIPDLEEFCKDATPHVDGMHDMQICWSTCDLIGDEEGAQLALKEEYEHRVWVANHLREQDSAGNYEDVVLEDDPEDSEYEDPRAL